MYAPEIKTLADLIPGTFFRFVNVGDRKHIFVKSAESDAFRTAGNEEIGSTLPDDSSFWNELCEVVPASRHDGKPLMEFSELASYAIDVQNACNLTGVVATWHRVTMHLRQRLELEYRDTDTSLCGYAINAHPVNVLFADKLASLAGVYSSSDTHDRYSAALQTCYALRDGKPHTSVAAWDRHSGNWIFTGKEREVSPGDKNPFQDA